MTLPTRIKPILLFCIACLLALSLAACGKKYEDALQASIQQFNASAAAVDAQLSKLVANTTLFNDPAWQKETGTALADWKSAAEALSELPKPEDKFIPLNVLVKELSTQTIQAADAFSEAIASGDIVQMNNGTEYLNRVKELLPHINQEMDRINQ